MNSITEGWLVLFGVVVQLLLAAFVYGRLTERVKTVGDRTVDHGARLSNIETVLTGTGGHGERLTALEAWRIENGKK
jgi:hypothetical protein